MHTTVVTHAARSIRFAAAAAAMVFMAAACADTAKLPLSAGTGPDPTLPPPDKSLIPTVHIAQARGWPEGVKPVAADGTQIGRAHV